jgi:ATP-dependent DNA helicase UvrD/PcrA
MENTAKPIPENADREAAEQAKDMAVVAPLVEAHPLTGLNDEKIRALKPDGNVLVIANPGTGKTLLLAHKYAQLISRGIKPEEILCLTYTNKAVEEMRQSIIRVLGQSGLDLDLSRISVTTFHAYALDAIGAQETISNNLLRYAIFRYLVDNRILTYGDNYLISTVVPKIEDSIRYLKSFGVLPDGINLDQVKSGLTEYRNITKEEMDRYAESFIEIFKHYEEVKAGKGIDYADMLLEFAKLRRKPHFKYALVDELQDASAIEAQMVIDSCDTFFVVGDKKQAIFAFQGGSILNFSKFENSTRPVLSENFRSTNQILEYARAFFLGKTKERTAAEEMRDLRNTTKASGPRPKVYGVAEEDVLDTVCELVQGIRSRGLKLAVLARTNNKVREISEELTRRGIEHSSTYFQASDDAHEYVVRFLLGIFSDRARDIKNAMFTPFFPITLKDAFSLAQLEDEEFLKELPERCPEFKRMKQKVRKLPDVDELFRAQIIPVAISYGRDYLMAALDLQKAFAESMRLVGGLDLRAVITYLRSSDLSADESRREKDVVLTTVHKAKGRQFEAVVYVPQEVRGGENFQDQVVKRILRIRSINVDEELEEEPIRIDFVALTRAKDELHVVAEDVSNYLNHFGEEAEVELSGVEYMDTSERLKRAFSLFASGDMAKSRELLGGKARWLREWVEEWFENLDHVSFSSLPEGKDERAAEDYLISKILDIRLPSSGLEIGSQVHEIANAVLKEEKYAIPTGLEAFVTNVRGLIGQVKAKYPETVASELDIEIPLEKLIGEGKGTNFQGRIDAVFRDGSGNYLLVDWKTDRDMGNASTHRQQLQAYRHAYSVSTGITISKVKVAIGFVGLRGRVNIGKNQALLDSMQPLDSAFETFKVKVKKVLEWKGDPDSFLKELGEGSKDLICRAVQEQYELETTQ